MQDMTRSNDSGSQQVAGPAPAADPAISIAHSALHARLVREHGEVVGALLAESAERLRSKAIERLRSLNARLSVAKEALAQRQQACDAKLAEAFAAMEEARTAWEEASRVYEAVRVAGQSDCVPLQNEIYAIVSEINRPDLTCRGTVKQWDHGDHVAAPIVPPDL